MTKKIFKSIFIVASITLLSAITVITGVLYRYFNGAQQAQLRSELQLVAEATEKFGIEYFDGMSYDRHRITWIDNSGNVTYDSYVDAETMQNHSDREEFIEALEKGKGSSTRYSATLTEETIYEAIRLKDGSVLRISTNYATALALVVDMLQPIAFILLIVVVLSGFFAHFMAKNVVKPFNELDLDAPLENDVYEELSPLLHKIHSQQSAIKQQMFLLKNKQEEFKQITEHMKETLVLLDNKDRIISMNQAAKELFCVEGDCEEKNFFAIDRKEEMRVALDEVKKKGKASFIANRNGRDYNFELSRIDADEVTQGVVILAFDVSDKINAEKNRREFTANVSHELKTPLQSIIGAAELLENDIIKEEDRPHFISNIRKEASRLVDLIEDIIRLSQMDEHLEMEKEEVSLCKIANEVRETLLDAAINKNIDIEVYGDDVNILGVHSLLYEMLYNLCDNAIKYNNPGGYVKIFIEDANNSIILRVEDNGIGISKEHHEKIFERFYRVDKSHSKVSGGTGLGLAIVKHAVLIHDGEIIVKSKVNEGTVIEVIFDKCYAYDIR